MKVSLAINISPDPLRDPEMTHTSLCTSKMKALRSLQINLPKVTELVTSEQELVLRSDASDHVFSFLSHSWSGNLQSNRFIQPIWKARKLHVEKK